MLSQTRNALGNLVNRYRAVLRKCRLCNAFGSLAVAAMLVMGGAGGAAAEIPTGEWWESAEDITLTAGEEWELNGVTHTNVQPDIFIQSGASMILSNSTLEGGRQIQNFGGKLTIDDSTLKIRGGITGGGTSPCPERPP